MPSSAIPEDSALVAALTDFAREMRSVGLVVGLGQVTSYCRALARLDPADLRDLYWAGRACLVSRQPDLATYDEVFAHHFLRDQQLSVVLKTEGAVPKGEIVGVDLRGSGAARPRDPNEPPSGAAASEIEILRNKDFAACSDEELEALRRLMAEVLVTTPVRKVRRTERARSGEQPDLRSALRDAVRADGIVFPRRWRRRRTKPRSLVLLLDISASMAEYTRALLQFAHTAGRGPGRVEVFCFGTRLTRISDALHRRNSDEALASVAGAVLDWEGGTMIGRSLREYNRTWGRRSGFRGSVVLICSDGLERGDPAVLADEMARLGRLSHRVIWVNPLKSDPGFEPATRGMRAALPRIDVLLSGHNLASLQELATLLPALG
ncbi:MAG: VWA domain-containing protein [Acidimicrobiia bacterium]|nr:VWA domain-containing protein [Acidimicrobiia bacterium]